MMFPQLPGKPLEKALIVKATPVSPDTQTPDELNAKAVREHITNVSRKVPVMETRACFPGYWSGRLFGHNYQDMLVLGAP